MPEESMMAVFEEIIDNSQNALVSEAMDAGRIPIGYTCSFVPEVLLSVDGLFPLRLRSPGIGGTQLADIYLPPIICSYCRSLLEYGMNGQYDFLGGWVFNHSCQHMNRLSDVVKSAVNPPFVHVLDALHTCTENTISWMVDELQELKEKLSNHFDVSINDDALKTAIAEHNLFVSVMQEIGQLRKLEHPPLTGAEFQKVMTASLAAPKDLLLGRVKEFRDSVRNREGAKDYRARLMVLGGAMDDPGYIEIIEEMGGLVVGDHFCTGSVPGLTPIANENLDPLERIARHTMEKPCPRMLDAIDGRLKNVMQTIEEHLVDGVIIQQLKFCDSMTYYGMAMAEYLREAGIPVLRVDREYRLSGEGQLRTRVQAFIESMGK
jgi:benzoyl-CoA reductase/2-hydroxyglutaryl-CoA dehydratase subunit BcrC/BadD/HgdB